MKYQSLEINHFNHDTFHLQAAGKVFYIDPYKLEPNQVVPADYLFITHEHFDHCSLEDIKKIAGQQTAVVSAVQCQEILNDINVKEKIFVSPGQILELDDVKVEAVPAYNLDKWRSAGVPFHPQDEDKVGFVLTIDQLRIYHAGDTDNIPEMSRLKDIDVAFLPVSGTYVMTAMEAAEACAIIKPKMVVPMHYGSVVGSQADAERFARAVRGAEVAII